MSNHPSLLNVPLSGNSPTDCEVAGLLVSGLTPALARLVSLYPDCQQQVKQCDIRPAAAKGDLAKAAFLPVPGGGEGASNKSVLAVLWEDGVEGLLSLSSSTFARSLLAMWRLSWSLQSSLYPHLRLSAQDLVSNFTTTHSWRDASVRCLAWHPHAAKLAVGLLDDTVRILPVAGHGVETQPLLKHAGMKSVSCLAWRPCSASQLAVGCLAGVLVWTVDPASQISRPSTSCVVRLTRPGHSPVTGLAWAPGGRLLASCSPADTNLIIWSPNSEACEPLRRVAGGGVSLVRWSLDMERLFCATPGSTFRVWSTERWGCDRWTVGGGKGRVVASSWSPDSKQLLFATSEEPVLYCVSFMGEGEAAVPVMDLTKVALDNGDLAGGLVQDIQWDPSGRRVAISFRETGYICLLRSRPGQIVGGLSPVGWVIGKDNEMPSCLEFQQSPVGCGAVLTVAWNGGRVQHIPMVFSVGEGGSMADLGISGGERHDSFGDELFTEY